MITTLSGGYRVKFRPDFTELMGTVAGGIRLRTPKRDLRARQLRGATLVKRGKGESAITAQGSVMLDGERGEFGPLTTTVLDEAVVTIVPSKVGKPSIARVEAPVYASAEAVALFAQFFGGSGFSEGMRVAQSTGECRFWPPK